jgi:hypothetical protein
MPVKPQETFSPKCFARTFRLLLALWLLVFQMPLALAEMVLEWQGEWSETGTRALTVELPELGHYSFAADADQPVRLRTVDRISGPGSWHEQRLDQLAMAGPVKLEVEARGAATGQLRIRVVRAREQNSAPFNRLPKEQWLETELLDGQQRSWSLVLDKAQTLSLEVAGRYLADLRLWRDGEWLEGYLAQATVFNQQSNQPLAGRQLHAYLPPGRYRLVAYGGQGVGWADNSEAAPLYLRRGIPALPSMGWWQQTASPFGVDRWRLSGPANRIEIRLPEAAEAQLSVVAIGAGRDPYQIAHYGESVQLDKDSRQPWEWLARAPRGDGESLVTVRRAPGESYRLSMLSHGEIYSLGPFDEQTLYLGVVGMLDPRDTVPATVLAYDQSDWREGQRTPLAEQLPQISASQGWLGRFNLQRETSLLFRVAEPGDYRLALTANSEAMASMRLQPMMADSSSDLLTQWRFGSEHEWMLEPGLYQLSLRPESGLTGIAELAMHSAAAPLPDQAAANVRDDGLAQVAAARDRYIRINDFEHGTGGMVIRPLPLTLELPLPVTQPPGARAFAVKPGNGRTLEAIAANGEVMSLALSADGPWRRELTLTGNETRRVWVRNDSPVARAYTLRYRPQQQPPLAASGALASDDELASLELARDIPVRYQREQAQSHLFQVREAGLYRLESKGLLNTAGQIRDRVRLDLASATGGGSGRNFLIQQYLGEGDYRLVSHTLGDSEGPARLQLTRRALRDGGRLKVSDIARTTLASGEAIAYRLQVEHAGTYRIHARGLVEDFAISLEGPDGWPLLRPGSASPVNLTLEPGEHRLVLLPSALRARAVTTVERVEPEVTRYHGYGPHQVASNQTVVNEWIESEDRRPVIWQFELSDSLHLAWQLDDAMVAELYRRSSGGWVAVDVDALNTPQRLAAGQYQLRVRAKRVDNRRDYRLSLQTLELPAGQQRKVLLPAELPIQLDQPGLVQLGTLSGQALEAELFDEQGRRLAVSDQRPDDWNPLISQALAAGAYTLRLTPLQEGGEALVFHRQPRFYATAGLAPGDTIDLTGDQGRFYPLRITPNEPPRVVAFSSQSTATHGIALERQIGSNWQAVSTATGRVNRGGWVLSPSEALLPWRLRVWPLDDQAQAIRIAVQSDAVPGDLPVLQLQSFTLDQAGLQRLRAEQRHAWQWASPGQAFQPIQEGWLPATDRSVWLLGPAELPGADLWPLTLASGALQIPLFPEVRVALQAPMSALRVVQLDSQQADAGLRLDSASLSSSWSIDGHGNAVALALPGQAADALSLQVPEPNAAQATLRVLQPTLSDERGAMHSTAESLSLEPRQARVLTVEQSTMLQAVLPAQTLLASEASDGRVAELAFAGQSPVLTQLRAEAGRLWLINLAQQRTTLRLLPAESDASAPGPWLLARGRGTSGLRQLVLPDGPSRWQIGGDVRQALWLSPNGGVQTLAPGAHELASGRLWLQHGSGAFAVWSDQSETAEAAPLRPGVAAWRLHAGMSGVWEWQRPEQATRWLWQEAGTPRWILPSRESPGRLHFHALGAAKGSADIHPQNLIDVQEGQGDWTTIAPGEAQLLSISLEAEGPLGLGLQSDRADLQASLLAADGTLLGDGPVQFFERLPAGRYLWRVRLLGDALPARYRPTLLGTQAPEDLVPETVRQRLMEAQP